MITNDASIRLRAVGERMAAALAHRGPDSSGVELLGPCLLVNTRLAIVDLSDRGRQPMRNDDGTVWITYNGECYNAGDLRANLEALGHRFRSSTDTEVVLKMYEEYGQSFIEKLRGMYAFAVWDSRAQSLFLARDRLGIKPLYLAALPNGLIFASEIKALLASGLLARKLDPQGITAFLELGHVPPPWTAVHGVQPLEPAEIAVWNSSQLLRRKYWKLPGIARNGGSPAPNPRTVAQIRESLLEASRLQLMADVPIALFLSGGIDSAAIGALMRSVNSDRLTALTVGFEEEPFDETVPSRKTAAILGIPHRVLRLSAREMAGSLDHAIWAMDQPTVDGINSYWICRAASEAGFKVALSGQGGDELFGGYESLDWFKRFTRLAAWMRLVPTKSFRGALDRPGLPFRWRKLSYLGGADDPFVAAQLAVKLIFLERDVRELLHSGLSEESSQAASHIAAWARQSEGMNLRERLAFMDLHTHLEPRLLRDADAMSMAHSLELRPVLLDHRIVEGVFSLPAKQRLHKKQLLLLTARESMPIGLYRELLHRPKRTFTFPFARWLSTSLRATMDETLRAERLRAWGVLSAEPTTVLWKRYLRSPATVGWSRVWSLFVLQRWCESMGIRP